MRLAVWKKEMALRGEMLKAMALEMGKRVESERANLKTTVLFRLGIIAQQCTAV